MIPAIQELNFPKIDGKQYATLTYATATLVDMGEKTISTQVKIDGDIVPDFSYDWEVEFQGEKYIMPLRIPQGAKENTSLNSTIDLTFQHWAIYQLKRWTFVTMQPIQAGSAIADEEVASVQLNLKDFCDLFGQVLEYYYGDTITIDFNDDPVTGWQYDKTPTLITIDHTYIWNVLIDAFHDKYGVRWAIEPREDNDNKAKGGERYVIKVGYTTTEVDHIFEYGFEGGLLKLERQVQSEDIRNMIKGRGSETNIPFRYFKDKDPKNPDFKPDPDWVEELANIYFTNLRGATFRSYVQGWKAAHISKYPGYKAVGESNAYAPWAYRKGFTDTKFHPEEFVADEITINPEDGDRQIEILPGYSPYIKKGSSIDKYGPLPSTLDNNDDIYPTIQGTGLDIAVGVEQIESDDVEESIENDAKSEDKTFAPITVAAQPGHGVATRSGNYTDFTVPAGKKANIVGYAAATAYRQNNQTDASLLIAELDYAIKVFNVVTGEQRSASGIPPGRWCFTVDFTFNNTSNEVLNVTCSFNSVKIESATPSDKWRNTFDIWVKNIWNTQKGIDEDGKAINETDAQYAERVWKPILGDREGNTAKVVFTSGALVHEDYEFTIVDFPAPDSSKSFEGERSHWRITLDKSDAELEATGLYVPSTQKQGKAGDTFAFIGTEMTHIPYVVNAEIRLDNWKKDHLGEVKEIKPTFVVTTDRVRLNNEGKPNALINQLRVGNSLRIADKRFIQPIGDRAYETLYLQSLTYTYREPSNGDAALNPDVEIVLSNEYATSANPVSVMQGEISSMQRLLGSISNVEQIVRAVGDKLYLRKGGIPDRSLSPTQFFSLLTSGDFRAGLVGGAGWGFFKDENGNWVLEADRVNVRQEMQVNTLVINQAEGRGGMEIGTAAFVEVTRVVETDNGYVCYFDQKNGSVANLFHVDDVAYCNRWTPENQELKFYKRRVTAVGVDNITLSKADVNGTGIPAEKDNIIHFGNYSDKTRQYVKVRDVVGGGYERYIEELNSVNAAGVEYYFVGKQAGESRWFVGNKDLVPYSGKGDGSYIEYINRRFNLNNVALSINTTIGDKTLEEYFGGLADASSDRYKYLAEALQQDTEVIGGVMLSTLISLGYKDSNDVRHTMAGMNGAWVDTLGGRTIASWWGGDMLDLFKADDTRKTLAELITESGKNNPVAAKSLQRMDGSAYFAAGNIGFRADGSGWLGNDLTGIKFTPEGRMTFGSGVVFDVSNVEGLQDTLNSIGNVVVALDNLFVPCDVNGVPLDGGWAEATQSDGAGGFRAKSLKAVVGLWSDQYVSGKGLGAAPGGTSGGGAVDLLTKWSDYADAIADSFALSAGLGYGLHTRLSNVYGKTTIDSMLKNFVTALGASGDKLTYTNGFTTSSLYVPFASRSGEVYVADARDSVDTTQAWQAYRTDLRARFFDVYDNGGPDPYGCVLEIAGRSGHWQPQLWFGGWANGQLRHRNREYNSSTWGPWHTLLDTANFASILEGNFVKTTGDSMTGDLTVRKLRLQGGNEFNCDDKLWLAYRSTPLGINLCHGNQPLTYGSAEHAVLHAGNFRTLLDQHYVTLGTDQEIGAAKTFLYNVTVKHPTTTGGSARGFVVLNNAGTEKVTFGTFCNVDVHQYAYIGWGADGWQQGNNLAVCSSFFRYKGNDVLHAANYASILNNKYVTLDTTQTITAKKTFSSKVGLATISNDWNIPVSDNSLCWLLSLSPAAANAPGTWYSGVSFMTTYTGFQLAVHGGSAEALKFRKIIDTGQYLAWRDILHSGNFNSFALPLTGGTLTGPLYLGSTSAYIFADSTYGAYLQNGTDYINLRSGKLFKNNSAEFLHTSNYSDLVSTLNRSIVIRNGIDTKLTFDNTDGESYTRITFAEKGTPYAHFTAHSGAFSFTGKPVHIDGKLGVGILSPQWSVDVHGSVNTDDWFRSTGGGGWYSQTYGGGIYMRSAEWVETYNKPMKIANRAVIGCNGFGVGLQLRDPGATSIEVCAGNYTMGLGCHSNGNWYWWRGTSNPDSTEGKSYVMSFNGDTWDFQGKIHSKGAIYSDTAISGKGLPSTSDIRLKDILGNIALPFEYVANAPVVRFRWRSGDDSAERCGTIAQYYLDELPQVIYNAPDGYYAVDYGALAHAEAVTVAREVKDLKRRIYILETENQELRRIKNA